MKMMMKVNEGVSLHADGCVTQNKPNGNVVIPEGHAENGGEQGQKGGVGAHGTACARARRACTSESWAVYKRGGAGHAGLQVCVCVWGGHKDEYGFCSSDLREERQFYELSNGAPH